jgi:hypothetical protein
MEPGQLAEIELYRNAHRSFTSFLQESGLFEGYNSGDLLDDVRTDMDEVGAIEGAEHPIDFARGVYFILSELNSIYRKAYVERSPNPPAPSIVALNTALLIVMAEKLVHLYGGKIEDDSAEPEEL